MRKIVAAFCDTDEKYRERFAAYLMQHKAKQLTLQVFSDPELLVSYMQREEADLIITGMGCEKISEEKLETNGVLVKLVDQKFILKQENKLEEVEGGKVVSIHRYQPMENILRELQIVVGIQRENQYAASGRDTELIGVISPARHDMQIPFSLLVAAGLAKERNVLYLNFMQFSGLMQNFHLTGEGNVGDLISRLRKKKLTENNFLRLIYETQYFSYIPPFQNPEQIIELLPEDFFGMIDFIKAQKMYEVMIIDFGTGVPSLADMLEHCDIVYCLTRKGSFYEGQMEEFLQYLERKGKGAIAERFQIQELPFSAKGIRSSVNPIEQLLWSEFGDYVRSCLSGETRGLG